MEPIDQKVNSAKHTAKDYFYPMTEQEQRLLVQLEEQVEWPSVYMFKFILKENPGKMKELKALFSGAEISIKESSKGSYQSFTAKEMMLNAMSVIERYRAVGALADIIPL